MKRLILMVICLSTQALAGELQLEHGQCRFGSERDGTFWQSDFGRQNYMTPRCSSIAYASKFNKESKLGYRIAYISTGDIEARDNIAVMNDIGIRNAPCSPPNNYDGCRVVMNGSGHMRGISISGTLDQKVGPITLIGEYGLLFFKSQFKAVAKPIDYNGPEIEINEESRWTDAPIPLVGLTLRYGNVYLAARHYWPAEHRALSLTNHAFTQISGGVAIPF